MSQRIAMQQSGVRALTILFVEDDELVRVSTAELMAEFGHTIVQASSGADALRLLDGGEVDLLMTDMTLPDMHGGQVAERAREQIPNLPVVFATGSNTMPRTSAGANFDGALMLRKPFSLSALNEALKTIADDLASR